MNIDFLKGIVAGIEAVGATEACTTGLDVKIDEKGFVIVTPTNPTTWEDAHGNTHQISWWRDLGGTWWVSGNDGQTLCQLDEWKEWSEPAPKAA